MVQDNQVKTVDTPTSGTKYTFVPRWGGTFVLVSASAFYQCGNAKVTYNRAGGASGSARTQALCQGSPGRPW